MPEMPPKVIHMPLEELMDPELSYDDRDSAGENPQAYVLKSEADRIAKALKAYQEAVWSEPGISVPELKAAGSLAKEALEGYENA